MASRDFGEVSERLRRSTVQVSGERSRPGNGSGVIWTADGVIITNAHVARGDRARVELWDGREFDAELTSRDARRDLAALRIPERDLPAAIAGDSSALRPGELVLAVGNPLGFIGALTTGVVHSLPGRQLWVAGAPVREPASAGRGRAHLRRGPHQGFQDRPVRVHGDAARHREEDTAGGFFATARGGHHRGGPACRR